MAKHIEIYDNGNGTWAVQLGSQYVEYKTIIVPSYLHALHLVKHLLDDRI